MFNRVKKLSYRIRGYSSEVRHHDIRKTQKFMTGCLLHVLCTLKAIQHTVQC